MALRNKILIGIQILMKKMMTVIALAFVLSACSQPRTGGFFGASNNGAAGGVTQSFRW